MESKTNFIFWGRNLELWMIIGLCTWFENVREKIERRLWCIYKDIHFLAKGLFSKTVLWGFFRAKYEIFNYMRTFGKIVGSNLLFLLIQYTSLIIYNKEDFFFFLVVFSFFSPFFWMSACVVSYDLIQQNRYLKAGEIFEIILFSSLYRWNVWMKQR